MIREYLWRVLAALVSDPKISTWLITRSFRTPYFHLDGYMNRWWLFNRYHNADGSDTKQNWLMRRLPSIRIHQILRADNADHMHDHPWDARTIILSGGYCELCEDGAGHYRDVGDTRAIRFGEYHHILHVSDDPTFTLFFTWKYIGTWGFLVDGEKVAWRDYLAEHPDRAN